MAEYAKGDQVEVKAAGLAGGGSGWIDGVVQMVVGGTGLIVKTAKGSLTVDVDAVRKKR